jgi:hypothetical protein
MWSARRISQPIEIASFLVSQAIAPRLFTGSYRICRRDSMHTLHFERFSLRELTFIHRANDVTQKNCPAYPFGQAGLILIWQRPTLPPTNSGSTIGAEGLNFRVRNGNGCDPLAMATRRSMHRNNRRNYSVVKSISHGITHSFWKCGDGGKS